MNCQGEYNLRNYSNIVLLFSASDWKEYNQKLCMEKEKSLKLNDSTCVCNLVPVVETTLVPKENVKDLILEIQKENTVDKKTTSSFKRTLISTADDRLSSKAIGMVGVSVMVSIGLLIVLSDIPIIISALRGKLIRE